MWFKKEPKVVVRVHQPTSKHVRVLKALKGGRKSNYELSKISLRFGGIIHELRKEGFIIVTHQVNGDGLFEYTYRGRIK